MGDEMKSVLKLLCLIVGMQSAVSLHAVRPIWSVARAAELVLQAPPVQRTTALACIAGAVSVGILLWNRLFSALSVSRPIRIEEERYPECPEYLRGFHAQILAAHRAAYSEDDAQEPLEPALISKQDYLAQMGCPITRADIKEREREQRDRRGHTSARTVHFAAQVRQAPLQRGPRAETEQAYIKRVLPLRPARPVVTSPSTPSLDPVGQSVESVGSVVTSVMNGFRGFSEWLSSAFSRQNILPASMVAAIRQRHAL
jgi:hypothetical protein